MSNLFTTINLVIKQGEYINQPVALEDLNGDPFDGTAYTLSLSVWNRSGEVLALTEGDGLSWITQASGTFRFVFTSAQTALLNPGTQYDYAVKVLRDADSEAKYPVRGNIKMVE